MRYLSRSEEINLAHQMQLDTKKFSKSEDTKILLKFIFWMTVLLSTHFLGANEICIECPHCTEKVIVEVEITSPQAREVPYAGWYCDNCGKFQCHGDRCTWCKHPRK